MTGLIADPTADLRLDRPADKPARPYFSSGPCAKPPGWALERLPHGSLGRSHRSKLGKSRLQHAIDLTREVLQVPDTHRIGIVPASDTGAVEMAMWSMLGTRPVTLLAWESFGEGWVTDAVKQLKLDPTVLKAPYGALPDLAAVDFSHDVIFTWNGTTSGVRVPDGAWIPADREGLTFADATSAAFAMPLPFDKLDVTTFSFQKVLGGEAAHGVLILSPRAVERLESYTPAWPLPKIFRMTKGGKLIEGIFQGETINTPSMLVIEDYIFSLEWAKDVGGLAGLIARSQANAAALDSVVQQLPWLDHLVADPAIRSNTSVCLKFADSVVEGMDEAGRLSLVKKLASVLEAEDVAYDIAGHRDAPAGLRIWCGATVDADDIAKLGPWLDWAWHSIRA
ncbi:phosphoserine transaminase [Sphingomonas sp.]|jgi:phosphoserine aminotransferase|uniref:phosphoserine transaminase n=1 Tax=Sphingomonas sp. TaxID=28214 RepID=UPI002DEAA687|nr:phosphoserine transaminase [Sphingomonas sp.]HEV2569708.1 phosphoserine transaminase [Sphingomonas sp.]